MITAAPELDPAGVQRAAALAEAGLIDSVVLLRPTLAEGPPPPPPDLPGVIVVYLSALLAEYDAQPLDDDHAESADLAALFHNGGTTGMPKLAAHTHGNEVADAWMVALSADLDLSLLHISEPTRQCCTSRMPSSA